MLKSSLLISRSLLASCVVLVADLPVSRAEVIQLQNPTATLSQSGGWNAALITDGIIDSSAGWAVYDYARGGAFTETAVVETASDVGFASGSRLTFALYHVNHNPQHGLGRFRLSYTTDQRDTFADGLNSGGDVTANWTVLVPKTATATDGVILTIQPDDSILASGDNPVTTVYTVTAEVAAQGITGFRIEALEAPSLPSSGPGRYPSNGNFVLTEFTADIVELPPLPPPGVHVYDLSADFSSVDNPAGPWGFGWTETLGGSFTLLGFHKDFPSDNGVAISDWQVGDTEAPAVAKVVGDGVAISAGGAFNGPSGTVYFAPGTDGTSRNFGVIRFTVPTGESGVYKIETAVQTVFDGPLSGDSDFHVVQNRGEVFGEFLPPNTPTGYTNSVNLVAGDTIDFVVGRGADGSQTGTALKIRAVISKIATPPPPGVHVYDLSAGFSSVDNPAGPWGFGWTETLGGSFTLLGFHKDFPSDNGVAISDWQVSDAEAPGVAKVVGDGVAISAGGAFNGPSGTVYFAPGTDGTSRNFGVIRFTVPTGESGIYKIETAVQTVFDGPLSGDSDFHVVRNGEELFGEFLPPNTPTGYTNSVNLMAGDTIDFVIGRGADGSQAGTSLKIRAVVSKSETLPPGVPLNVVLKNTAASFSQISGWNAELITDGVTNDAAGWAVFDFGRGGAFEETAVMETETDIGFASGSALSFVLYHVNHNPQSGLGRFRLSYTTDPRDTFADGLNSGGDVTANWIVLTPKSATATDGVILTVQPDDSILASGDNPPTSVYSVTAEIAAQGITGFRIEALEDPSLPDSGPGRSPNGNFVLTEMTVGIAALPPSEHTDYVLSRDFSPGVNPSGAWSYGAKPSLSGALSVFGINGLNPFEYWQLVAGQEPTIYHNGTPDTITIAGGLGVFPPGTTFLYSGTDGAANPFGVVRFTAPESTNYVIQSTVAPVYDGAPQGDTDFHVVKNGIELFGRFLGTEESGGYSNIVSLVAGDTLDFMVGRGHDNSGTGSGLKIAVTISPTDEPPSHGSVLPPPGLVAWWPLEEDGRDIVGGNNGALLGEPAFGDGWVNHAMLFDGADDAIRVPASSSLDVGAGPGMTVELWVKPTQVDSLNALLEWSSVEGPEPGFHLYTSVSSPGSLFANLTDTDGVAHHFSSASGVIKPGVFQHIAFSYDRPTGIARFYVDGVLVAQENMGSLRLDTTADLWIGQRILNGPAYLSEGIIDEISLYGRALTSEEIFVVYDAGEYGKTHPTTAPPGLVAWWPLEEDGRDIVGGNNGALLGEPAFGDGWVNRAMLFDGADDSIRVPASSSLDVGAGPGMTVELWVKPTQVDSPNALLEWSSVEGPEPGFHLFTSVLSPGSLFANLMDSSGVAHHFTSAPGVIKPAVFQHIAFSYDKPTGVARFYVDGVLVAEENMGSLRLDTTADLWIGQRILNGPAYLFGGVLDEISVYNRALSAGEVSAIFGSGEAGKIPPINPPPVNRSPVAQIVIEPSFDVWPDQTNIMVIAVDGIAADVLLDGSLSSDPDGDALEYFWAKDDEGTPFAAGVVTTNSLAVGTHSVTLLVSDATASGTETVSVEVITLEDSLDELYGVVLESEIKRNDKRPLLATLERVSDSFANGRLSAGAKQLRAFQQKTLAQLARNHRETAERLLKTSQQIIEAIELYLEQYDEPAHGHGHSGSSKK